MAAQAFGAASVCARFDALLTRPRLAIRRETAAGTDTQSPQLLTLKITAKGFEPGSIALRPGVPARVTFIRSTDETCATSLVMPAYGISRALPLNEPLVVAFTPTKDAEFQCGMGMLSGKLVVRCVVLDQNYCGRMVRKTLNSPAARLPYTAASVSATSETPTLPPTPARTPWA